MSIHLQYFTLKKEPFSIVPDPSFLYPSHQHRQAVAHLKYGLDVLATDRGSLDNYEYRVHKFGRDKVLDELVKSHQMTYDSILYVPLQNDFSNNSLMFSGNVDLTPKWKVGVSSGYDFKGKGFTYTQLRFDRDLNSWRLNFSWVPFSDRASWNFFIGIKSGLLSDIKYEKQSEPYRQKR